MKKLLSLLAALALLLTACGVRPALEETSDATTTETETTLPVYVPGSIKINPGNDYGEYTNYKKSFRVIYYNLPGSLQYSVGEKEFCDFADEYEANQSDEEMTEMLMVTFIKHFNIPKSQFIEIFEEKRAFWAEIGLDMTHEDHEIPNADIIYTFNNEIINEYYRRE
ncbi:MAG: hypothetical protein FWE98_06900 [Oscillospiraceae bacterium]|nr:hypothetical protein [Oscillospiraceae bacterium]